MNFNEKIQEIKQMISQKKFDDAEKELNQLINDEKIKSVEDEKNTYYTFNTYIESLLFFNYKNSQKPNVLIENNISTIYYYLGYINIETKNFGKALQFLNEGLKWNPMDVEIMFEKAAVYRFMGDIERFRAEVLKTHKYIHTSWCLGKYYREIGWYYAERRVFDLANALYTESLKYADTEIAINELKYIAQQERRNPRYSTAEEISKLFEEYNIERFFDKNLFDIIHIEYQRKEKQDKESNTFKMLSRTLYNMTLAKEFMLYNLYKDEQLGIQIKVPEKYPLVDKSKYKEFGIPDNTVFMFADQSQKISIVCDGKCELEQLDEAYKLNIENIKKNNTKTCRIIREYTIRGNKNINRAFVEVKNEDQTIKLCQNYLIVNGYLFNVSWKVPNDILDDQLLDATNKTFFADMLFSLSTIEKNMDINKAAEELVKKAVEKVKNNEMKKEDSAPKTKLKIYSQEIKNYPTFKFYFPENLGDLIKKDDYIFEIKQGDVQKIRVAVVKCKKENFEKSAKEWIEKSRNQNNQEIVEYKKETINNIPIETYVLKNEKNIKRIYKAGYINGYKITLSGGMIKGKEEMINTAFEKIEWDEPKENTDKKKIKITCFACKNEFELNWNVPSNEKIFYCKCPNCNAELKQLNPNYNEDI